MIDFLPTLNAILNATSAILLIIGRRFIKNGNRVAHKKFMIAAFTTSILFLISYLTFHALRGSTKFLGEGISRTIYFSILISHTFLAAFVPFFALFIKRGCKLRCLSETTSVDVSAIRATNFRAYVLRLSTTGYHLDRSQSALSNERKIQGSLF